MAKRNNSESSESEEDRKKPTIEITKDSEFSSLYELYTENPKFR